MGPGRLRRVVVLAHASVLDRTGYARRAIDSALAWARVVRDGTVVLATLESPRRLRDRDARAEAQREVEAGGARLAVLHALPRRLGLRGLSDAMAARAVRRLLARERADVVHAHGPRAAATALAAARGLAVHVVADVHGDRAAEARLERGETDDAAAAPARAEAAPPAAAHGVVHASEALAARFPPAPGRPSVVVPCLVAEGRIPSDADAERLREEGRAALGFQPGDAVLAYAGSLAPWQEVPRLARLLARATAANPGLRVLFASSDARGAARALAAAGVPRGATRVVSPAGSKVVATLCAADAGVLLRRPALANALAFPTKVAEYLAAGLAVVSSDAVPAARIEVEAAPGLGTVVPWAADDETWAARLAEAAAPASPAARASRRARARARLGWAAGDASYRALLHALERADPAAGPAAAPGLRGARGRP